MGLGVDEATRVLRFCLAGDGWGTAVDENGACVLKVMVNRVDAVLTYRFEAGSYEEALMQGVEAGILKASSVERQIAFISREAGAAPVVSEPPLLVDATVFSALTTGVSALVHESQRERGISALYTASGAGSSPPSWASNGTGRTGSGATCCTSDASTAIASPRTSGRSWTAPRPGWRTSLPRAAGSVPSRRCRLSSSRSIRA